MQTAGGAAVARQSAVNRFSTGLHALAFIAGFTFVFVAFGLLSTAFIQQIGGSNLSLVRNIIGRVGGLVIIFFGLHFMGVMPALFNRLLANRALIASPFSAVAFALLGSALILWALIDWLIALPLVVLFLLWLFLGGAFTTPEHFWTTTIGRIQTALYSDTRRQMSAGGREGLANSALMGVVFSAGWTPCIGPVYGAVLTMAYGGTNIGQAGALLVAYSLGLGVPFLLTALLMDSAQAFLHGIQRQMRRVELVSGAFLVVIGLAVASGSLQSLSQTFAGQFSDFSVRVEECVIGAVQGEIPLGDVGACLSGDAEANAST
jgi:cytochrome c-type biogenesis protein